jgi:preprotein translocase subunit SecD
MATKLEKDVIRESNIVVDERNIMVTLTKNQEVSLKLKGLKSGELNINIEELYNLLNNKEVVEEKPEEVVEEKPKKKKRESITIENSTQKKGGIEPMINLHDFRSQYIISADIPYEIKVALEKITVELINKQKNI